MSERASLVIKAAASAILRETFLCTSVEIFFGHCSSPWYAMDRSLALSFPPSSSLSLSLALSLSLSLSLLLSLSLSLALSLSLSICLPLPLRRIRVASIRVGFGG